MEGVAYRSDGLVKASYGEALFDDGYIGQYIFVLPKLVITRVDHCLLKTRRSDDDGVWYSSHNEGFETSSRKLITGFVDTHASTLVDNQDESRMKELYDMVTKIRETEEIFKEMLRERLHVYTDVKPALRD